MRPKALIPLLALGLVAPPSAHAGDDPATTFVNKAGEAVFYTCRDGDQPEDKDTCNQVPFGRRASRQAVTDYGNSWTHRALTLQYDLASDVPFANAPWVGTHNSFNSMAYGYTPSRSDSNQQLKLADQLAIDVRSLELDIHQFNGEARVCHAADFHVGCSAEGPIGPYLKEIADFLEDHKDQVLLLYLEDNLDDAQGYKAVTDELDRVFGSKLYRSPGGCTKLPLTLTRNALLEQGAQVIAVANGCGGGNVWPQMVFDWRGQGDIRSEDRPRGFQDFPACSPNIDRATYDSRIVRYFEDSTFVTSAGSTVPGGFPASSDDGITPETAAAMTRCGVDLFGFDQLLPDDGRLEALVWSWAKDEPSASGDCAVQRRADARWEATSCNAGRGRRGACHAPDGSWLVTADTVKYKKAASACAKQGASFAVPRTGYENALLDTATPANAGAIWLGYRRESGEWHATDAR